MNANELANRLDGTNLKFEDTIVPQDRFSEDPSVHAIVLLDKLTGDAIAGADHDVIYLTTNLEALAKVITEQQILQLIACGVFYNIEADCLSIFV